MKVSRRPLARRSLGAMLATRQGSLTLALLTAACAGVVLLFALSQYKSGVQKPVPQATVLVATREIPKGTSGTRIAALNLYRSTPVVASQLTAGAIADAGQLTGVDATANIMPGQQLTTTDFSALSGVDTALAPNQRALEVTISESPGAVDVTQPGDHVDVYTTAGPSGGQGNDASSLIAGDVDVIKPASPTPIKVGNRIVTGSSMVLALNQSVVGQVIKNSGTLYLALRPKSAPQP